MADSTTNTKLENKEPLVFINENLPQMVAGRYAVNARLEVNNNKDFKDVARDFWVDAPRFILNQSDIYTVYPPRDATGRFETTVPHIVFNRRTLPWERTVDGKTSNDTEFKDEQGHAPWLGLVMLNEDEIKDNGVTIEQKTLKELFTGTDIFVPQIDTNRESQQKPVLSPWEKDELTCETIDIPTQLFKRIVPRKDDLPFLGHVRKVLVDDNKESADIDDAGYFSTLICSRLPSRNADETKAMINRVFLVSLEGYHNFFKNPAAVTKSKVRLVVLSSWSFTVAKGKNFKELCDGLRVSTLRMNYKPGVPAALQTAYDYGYTLLPHETRDGSSTFSWYRGPFNPNFLPAARETRTFVSADEALRFDYNTGLFDVSYAAAWQLGRMLALKDKTFSTALHQWKMQGKQMVLKTAARKQLLALLPDKFVPADATVSVPEDLVKEYLTKYYNNESTDAPDQKTFSTSPEVIQAQLKQLGEQPANIPEAPKEVKDWLGKLFLLYGVPLNYLLPHENYLASRAGDTVEKEALGTFYIDYNWIEALLGGALGIVSSDDSLALLKRLKDGEFLPDNLADNKEVADTLPVEEGTAIPMPKNISEHITGFLMRSELVSGWKGVKIFPQDKDGKWMSSPLRIERIADDIKLCVFSGKVQQVLIIQPPEGTHFGVEQGADKQPNKKKLRNPDGTIDDNTKIDITFRDSDKNVINLATVAATMRTKKTRGGGPDAPYSSADLAFQMLESAVMYTLKINDD